MAHLLHIETATTLCSVSISKDAELVALKELNEGYTHAENLHLFIEDLLKTSGTDVKQLAAISVSKGPGSYTGLRIGSSAAKGLAYALNIPLIGIDTLEIMTSMALDLKKEKAFFCPMIDARRMEVYCAVYDQELKQQLPVEALILDETSILKFKDYTKIYFFGNGMPKSKELLSTLPNASFIEDIAPSARYMPALAFNKFKAKNFENTANFEPFYLKEFLIKKK